MARIELVSGDPQGEAMAELADAYRAAVALLALRDWGDNACPDDALKLAVWLRGEA